MRILILSQWFDPEPTFKGLIFAKSLIELGHEVEVITGFPNYPGGNLYPGYKVRWLQKEVMDGVNVTRVPLYPSHDKSAKKRIFNYISFAMSATLYGIFGSKKADVIYVYHPPATVGMAGALIGLCRRTPFVYDIQDLWPDTLRATGMLTNSKVLSIVSKVCSWVYSRATKIVVLSPGFKKLIEERGVPADKIFVIYNWCDEQSLALEQVESKHKLPDGFNIVFAGNMGPAQALETVLEASEKVAQSHADVNFVLVGGGLEVDGLKSIVAQRKMTNVHFIPRMPIDEVGSVLTKADALLVHLKKDDLFKITIPSKTQAYLAKGKPILMGVSGDAAELVEKANAGICFEPENTDELVSAAIRLRQMPEDERVEMGDRAKDHYQNHLSLKVGVKHFIGVFRAAVRTKRGCHDKAAL